MIFLLQTRVKRLLKEVDEAKAKAVSTFKPEGDNITEEFLEEKNREHCTDET